MAADIDTRTTARSAFEVDGRLLCWRCRCEVDDDFFCSSCGAISIPSARRPTTSGPSPAAVRQEVALALEHAEQPEDELTRAARDWLLRAHAA